MEAVLKAWNDIDWDVLQARVEAEIDALDQRQEDAEQRRSRLVEESNMYRERTDKDSRKVALPLIKAFQKEVDGLIARSQTAESALISVCAQITNLPDPKALLAKADAWRSDAEKTHLAVDENSRLRHQVALLNEELSTLKNQDVQVRKLKEKLRETEDLHDEDVSRQIDETTRGLQDEFAERIEEMMARHEKLKTENGLLEKKVNELESRNRETQRRFDDARLAADRQESLESEQLDIAMKDLGDAKIRIVTLEEQVARLNAELDDSRASNKRNGLEDIAALGGLMIEKDEQINKLADENKKLATRHDDEARQWKEKLAAVEREVAHQRVHIDELKKQLAEKDDYEAIKKELRLLREIEFGEAAEANNDSIERLGETVQSLDRLLAEKNRRLQNENASLRMMNEGFKGDVVMKAIVSGSHQHVVDAVGKKVGREIASNYKDPEVDVELLEKQVQGRKSRIQEVERHKVDDAQPTLFNMLMKMGANVPTVSNLKPLTLAKKPEGFVVVEEKPSPVEENGTSIVADKSDENMAETADVKHLDAAYDLFRYSPKISNYTGEVSKTPQEIQAIEELQSQGSLSELLSKPRHWGKLTDKGREAFRRIYGWISDDRTIEMLCSLSPRRVWPKDVRVEHPTPESLWESYSGALPNPEPREECVKRPHSAREDQYRLAGTSQAANAGSTTRNSRWRHDDIPKERITSIFETELAKLKEQESNLERAIASRSFSSRLSDDLKMNPDRASSIDKVMSSRMKTGLAPITQEQFESFGHVDTEQVVRQIKEFLSLNSISQRQFGEHVLGLSQGSVSDLLARPKQWSMLTQKGREPFIRMKLFMQDVSAADGDSQKSTDESCSSSVTDHQEFTTMEMAQVKKEIDDEGFQEASISPPLPLSEIDVMMQLAIANENSKEDLLDTNVLVRKVKDRLHLHGVSQRLFGDVVLGLSAAACSELFLRPRPWNAMSSRVREPYEKMRQWLADKDAVYQLVRREQDGDVNSSRASSLVSNGLKHKLVDPPYVAPPKKVQRTVISEHQKEALRFVFQHEHHPSQKTVELLAIRLNLNIRTVNNWFHNHRTRQKASLKEGKIYSDTICDTPKSDNWQQDLALLLDSVSAACLEESLPTMVTIPMAASFEPNTTATPKERSGISQLDRAVAKMRQIAEQKCAEASE